MTQPYLGEYTAHLNEHMDVATPRFSFPVEIILYYENCDHDLFVQKFNHTTCGKYSAKSPEYYDESQDGVENLPSLITSAVKVQYQRKTQKTTAKEFSEEEMPVSQ